jgi:hypothetical protein
MGKVLASGKSMEELTAIKGACASWHQIRSCPLALRVLALLFAFQLALTERSCQLRKNPIQHKYVTARYVFVRKLVLLSAAGVTASMDVCLNATIILLQTHSFVFNLSHEGRHKLA